MNVSCTTCQTIFRVDPGKVPPNGVRARCSVCSGVFWVQHIRAAESAPAVVAERPLERPIAPPVLPPLTVPVIRPKAAPPPRVESPPPVASPVTHVPRFAGPAVPPTGQPARPRPLQPMSAPVPPAVAGPARVAPRPAAPPALPPATSPTEVAPPARVVPLPTAEISPPAAANEPGFRQTLPVPLPRKGRGNPFLSQDPSAKARRLARALISDMVVYHPAKRREGIVNGSLKQLFDEEIKKSWEEYVDQVGRDLAQSTPFFTEALNEILGDGKVAFP